MKEKIWIITDTHLGHDKMVEYCGRPKDHSDIILKNIHEMVGDDDILIHLGDVCIGHDEDWNSRITAKAKINILIRGNHDHQTDNWYMNHGWYFVAEKIEKSFFGKKVMLSHFPAPIGDYDVNLHGHFHNSLQRLLRREWVTDTEEERNKKDLSNLNPKSKLLAIESTDYKPVLLNSLLK